MEIDIQPVQEFLISFDCIYNTEETDAIICISEKWGMTLNHLGGGYITIEGFSDQDDAEDFKNEVLGLIKVTGGSG